jgi:hypothetical protein
MGFFDSYAPQDGGGMMGGLPASWQYQNPDSLTPEQRQLMALVGTQQNGFGSPPAAPGAFPVDGAAPLAGMNSPLGTSSQPAPAPMVQPPVAPAGIPMPPISSDNSAPPIAPGFAAVPAPNNALPGAAPPTAFGSGAAPIFAAPPNTPGTPALPNLVKPGAPPAVADDGEEDPAASPIKVGGVQMPRIGDQAAFTPDPAALPANSRPAQGFAVPGQPAAAAPSPVMSAVGDRLKASWQSMRHGGGLIGGLSGLVTGERDDPQSDVLKAQASTANMTARALIGKNVPPEIAMAAVQPGNGEMLKALITQVFSKGEHGQETDKDGNIWDVNKTTGQRTIALASKDDKFQHVTTKNFDGSETKSSFNTKTGEYTAPAGGNGPDGAKFGSLLKPGVTYDANKSGEDYMAQFGPEVQSAAKAYINGDIMPTGNARKDSVATFAKNVALKYGQDTGIPVSDSTYAAKRKMKTDLASSGNSSMGGILSNGESAFKHLAEYAAGAADQGNTSHNFPLGGLLASGQNYVSNTYGGSDTRGKVKALNDNLGHYGQESTKFYAGTGGGVEERMHALKELNATSTSGEEAAAYAEKEKNLMTDRLNSKLQEIKNVLGEEEGNREIAKHMPDIQKHMALIDANVRKLRGEATAATAAESSASIPSLKVGESTKINGVSIKKVGN